MTDLIVVGGGISGMTACLYALRGGKSVMLIESESIGGQIASSPRVENFPSVKEISGAELADKVFEQITALGAEITLDKVVKIEKTDDVFTVVTEYGEQLQSKAVILATGVKHRKLLAKNAEKYEGKGIYYCAVCDGAFYKGKDVAVVGDANSALQYALYLSNICSSVTIVTLFDRLFGDSCLADKVRSLTNVKIIHNKNVIEFNGEEVLKEVVYEDTLSKEISSLKVDAVFIAIGQVPDNQAFKDLCDLDKNGYIDSDEACFTKTEGLFVAGDTRTKKVRQLTTACSDGAVAALNAINYIDRK